jgi:hypothetical protein
MTRWTALRGAALVLDVSPAALRKRCERNARLGADGVIEAQFDGVCARTFGGRWRVQLGEAWSEPAVVD